MRTLFLFALCLFISACNQTGLSSHRPSYVISKSTAAETEAVTEQMSD